MEFDMRKIAAKITFLAHFSMKISIFEKFEKYRFMFEIESKSEESIKNWSGNIINGPWLWILDTVRKKNTYGHFLMKFRFFQKIQKIRKLCSKSIPNLKRA